MGMGLKTGDIRFRDLGLGERSRPELAGAEDWTDTRRRYTSNEDVRDCVLLAMMNVKHSVIHRPKIGACVKATKERERSQGSWDYGSSHFGSSSSQMVACPLVASLSRAGFDGVELVLSQLC